VDTVNSSITAPWVAIILIKMYTQVYQKAYLEIFITTVFMVAPSGSDSKTG
jgi:hypothetical protein